MADLRKFYDNAVKKGVIDPSVEYDTFVEAMYNEDERNSFYKYATKHGLDIGEPTIFNEYVNDRLPNRQQDIVPADSQQAIDQQQEPIEPINTIQQPIQRTDTIQAPTSQTPQAINKPQSREIKFEEVLRPEEYSQVTATNPRNAWLQQPYQQLTDEELDEQIKQLSNPDEQKARELYKIRYGKDYTEPVEPTSWWEKHFGNKARENALERSRWLETKIDASRIEQGENPEGIELRNERLARLKQEKAYRNRQDIMPALGEQLSDLQERILSNEKQDGVDIRGAKHLLNQTIDLYNAPTKYGRSNGFVNWSKGLADQITDYDTWTAGISELARMDNLNGIVNKMNKGGVESLTKEEQLVLESFLMSTAVQDVRDDLSTGYTIGQGAAQSIPFMVEMYLTAGAGSLAKRGLVQLAERKLGTAFANKLARAMGGTIIKDAAGNFVERGATRTVAGKVGKTLAYDFAQTAAMPSTYANMYKDRVTELLQGDGDYGFRDFVRSFAGNMVETGTERWGGRLIDMGASKMIPAGVSNLWGKNKLFGHFVENYINSPIGETGEEIIAAGVNALRSFNPLYSNVDDKSISSNSRLRGELGEIMSPEGLGRTFLTILPMSVFGGATNAATNRAVSMNTVRKYGKARKDIHRLLFLNGATNEEASQIITQIESSDSDKTFFDKVNMVYSQLLQKHLIENPDESEEDAKSFQAELDKKFGAYVKQAGLYNEMVGDLMEKYNKLSDEEKESIDNAMENFMVRTTEDFVAQHIDEINESEIPSQQTPEPEINEENVSPTQEVREKITQEVTNFYNERTHGDGNVYPVADAGNPDKTGYIIGNTTPVIDTTNPDKWIITNNEAVTVKWDDGTVGQVSAKDLDLTGQPHTAQDYIAQEIDARMQQHTAERMQAGENPILMRDQEGNVQGFFPIISEEGLLEDENGSQFTSEQLAEQGWQPVEQELPERPYKKPSDNDDDQGGGTPPPPPASGAAPVLNTPQEPTIPDPANMSVADLTSAAVEFFGDKITASDWLDIQLKDAKQALTAAQRLQPRSKDAVGFRNEMQQIKAQRQAAEELVKKIEQAKFDVGHYKTQAEKDAEVEAERKAAELRAQRRQTEIGKITGTPAEKWNKIPKIQGNAVTRTLPDGTKITGHYILAEAGTATPSHDPFNNWNTSEGFPVTEDGRNINDRDYKNDADAQAITTQIAQTYDGQAVEQVPVVSSEGIVYDGNGRTIAGHIAAVNNTDAAYLEALKENAANFGFTPEQIAQYQHPRVYLQTDEDLPYNTTTFAKFNAQEKKTQSNTNRAIGNSKKLTEAARDGILKILESYATLDSFFASESGTNDVISSLLLNGVITQQEVAGLTESTRSGNLLSPTGKDYITDLLIGALFDEQTIKMLGNDRGLKQSILRALPSIIENRRLNDYALTDDINNAIKLLYEARQAGMDYQLYVLQGNLIDGFVKDRYSAFEMLLAEEMSAGVEQFRQVLKEYNVSAAYEMEGQSNLFGLRTSEDIKQETIDYYAKQRKQPTATAAGEQRPANTQTEPAVPSTPTSNAQEVTPPSANSALQNENNSEKPLKNEKKELSLRSKDNFVQTEWWSKLLPEQIDDLSGVGHEEERLQWAKDHKDEIIEAYIKGNGHTLDPDKLRLAFIAIGYDGSNVNDYAEAEGYIRELLYDRIVQDAVKAGNPTILFLTGNGGAGKSTLEETLKLKDYGVVVDSSLNHYSSLDELIKRAAELGIAEKDMEVAAVYNDLFTSYTNGLNRGQGSKEGAGVFGKGWKGRSIRNLAAYLKAYASNNGKLQSLIEEHPDVVIIKLKDNSHNKNKDVTIDEALKWDYTIKEEELDELIKYIENEEYLKERRLTILEGLERDGERLRETRSSNEVGRGIEGIVPRENSGNNSVREDAPIGSGRHRDVIQQGGTGEIQETVGQEPDRPAGVSQTAEQLEQPPVPKNTLQTEISAQVAAKYNEQLNNAIKLLQASNEKGLSPEEAIKRKEQARDAYQAILDAYPNVSTRQNLEDLIKDLQSGIEHLQKKVNKHQAPKDGNDTATKADKSDLSNAFDDFLKNNLSEDEFKEAQDLMGDIQDFLNSKYTKQATEETKLDDDTFRKARKLTSLLIKAGVRKFADYCRMMIGKFGDAIRGSLRELYMAAKSTSEAAPFRKEMDSEDFVYDFDVENFETEKQREKSSTPTEDNPNRVIRHIGEITKSKHTQTGEDLWIVKPTDRVSDAEFKQLKQRAKDNNGYYSSFAKNRGFIFKSEQDANNFNNIEDEQTTDQTAADTNAIAVEGQTVAAEAAAIERDRRDNSGAEGELGGQSDEAGSTGTGDVTLTPEQAEQEFAKRQQTIDKIDEAVEKHDEQLALLGYYEADKTGDFHKTYGYRKSAENKAIADADRLAKQLAADLGIEISKRKKLATANIPPAGGDITFRLPLNEGRELYFDIQVNPNYNGNYYRDNGNSDDLAIDHIMWRVEDPNATDSARYGDNHHLGLFRQNNNTPLQVTYAEVLQDIRVFARNYLPQVEVAPNTTRKQIIEQAAEKQKKRKADKKRIEDNQQVLDLFGDVVEEINNSNAEEQNDPIGELVDMYNQDMDEWGRPERKIGNKPINTPNDEQSIRRNGSSQSSNGRNGTDDNRPQRDSSSRSQTEVRQGVGRTDERAAAGDSRQNRQESERRLVGLLNEPVEQLSEKERRNTRNFRYDAADPAPTSNKARYEANLAAIRLLKELQAADRQATPEEQRVLAKFTGWGGLGEFFKGEPGTTYYSQHGEQSPYQTIKALLTDEEMEAAQLSRNSAYYTPAPIIDTLWDVAKRLGFKGGNILEGSAGIGNILAQMPQGISDRSQLQAVEIDPITAGILAQLYPDAQTHAAGFQEVNIPNNSQDLVITNVPFVTGLRVYDKQEKDISKRFGNIHDFCIAKNVRKLKQGGLGIFITSSGTLDSSKDLRRWLNNEGDTDVIGAFRMNRETFGGTSVTSDIIVVRKRVNGQKDPRAIDVLDTMTDRIALQEQEEQWNRKKGQLETPEAKEVKLVYNKYFVEHPEAMGGEMGFGFEHGDTRWGGTTAGCYADPTIDQNKRLQQWVESLKQGTETVKANGTTLSVPEDARLHDFEKADAQYGALVVDSKGTICKSIGGRAIPVEGINPTKVKGQTKAQVLKDYNAIKTALDELLAAQTKDISDEELKPYLNKLNSAYNAFVRKYGNLNRNTAISFLRNDVQWASIAALEDVKETVDANGKKKVEVNKTDVFSKRVVGVTPEPKAENIKDGIILSVQQTGTIRPDKIAEWLQKPQEDVEKEIIESRLGFRDPQTGNIQVRHEYLSGNVREKLAYAEEHNENGEYNTNIEELRKVIPIDIPAHLIEFNIGSTWIPTQLYQDYLREKFDVQNLKLVHVNSAWVTNDTSYSYSIRNEKNRAEGVYSDLLHEQVYGHQLMIAAMNNVPFVVSRTERHSGGTTETITDKQATAACSDKISQMKDDFVEWARGKMQQDNELAEQIQKLYNDRFNAIVPMLKVDDAFLSPHLPGQNHKYEMYRHQQNAVARSVTQPIMLAHEVGTGKTITLISTAMEMRRLGTAKKPMIVVQNATTPQFVKDAKDLYPNAKILTVSERDRTKEGRQEFYAKIKYNDWDLIIIPQSVFDMIPDSESRMRDFIQEKIDEKIHAIEAAKEAGLDQKVTNRMEKELENLREDLETNNMSGKRGKKATEKDAKKAAEQRANAEARAQEMLDRKTDDVADFDDMGIDALLIDEAHNYKHLGFATMMTRGVKGIDPSYSKRAAALYLKCQSVYERQGHRNVVFATGTPISNTAAEIWTFMKYLLPKSVLQENEIYYFDDFVHNFGKINEQLEFATNGKFKANNRFAQYGNVPELMRMWLSCADCVLTREVDQVNDKVPDIEGGKAQDIFLPQSPSLIDIMAAVRAELERYEHMSGKEKKENSHIPLTMYGIAKRAAIDPRLVDANAADEPLSKTNRAVEEVLRSLNDSKKYNGTVAIFCDSYQNKQSGFNLFQDIKDKLVKKGIPASKIAIIRSDMTDTAKQKIFDAVREGEIRVIMGSTQTLGTGVNIQTRLHTLIHMDAPDRPMDYTQRNGRIIRQGNMHKQWGIPVRVLRFGVEDSLDVTSYQRLKTKAGFIDSIMNGKSMIDNNLENRVLEDVEEGIFDNPVAMLSGSQFALLKTQAERDLRKWSARKQQHIIDQILIASRLKDNESWIKNREQKIKHQENLLEMLAQKFPDGKVDEYNVNGIICHTKEELKAAFKELDKQINELAEQLRKSQYIGNDQNFGFNISFNGVPVGFNITLSKDYKYKDGQTVISIKKHLRYGSDTLSEDWTDADTVVPERLVEYIKHDILSGKEARERIEGAKAAIERANKENELMRQREGKPFEHEAELAKAQQLVDEYTEKMKAELAEKEAKYAQAAKHSVDLSKMDSEDDTADTPEAMYDELDYDPDNLTPAEQLGTDAVAESLKQTTGLDLNIATDEEVAAQKKSLNETATWRELMVHTNNATVVSSNDGAKILKKLESTKQKYEIRSTKVPKTVLGDIAAAAGLKNTGLSNYGTFETVNGTIVTLRVSNHNATTANFDNEGEAYGISIVISSQPNQGIDNANGKAHLIEYYFKKKDLAESYSKPIADILGDIINLLKTGEYHDTTGLAQVQEVNPPAELQLYNEEVDEIVRRAGREPQQRELMQGGGKLYGWAVGNRIYLTKDGLNPNSPIHEYSHLWVKAIKKNNPELYKNLQDLFSRKNLPQMYEELDNDPNYAGLSEEGKMSEVFARFSGKRGAQRMTEEAEEMMHEAVESGSKRKVAQTASLIQRMKALLKKAWEWIGEHLFNIKSFGSREEASDRALYDLLNQTDLKLDNNDTQIEKSEQTPQSNLTRSQIITKALVERSQENYRLMMAAAERVNRDLKGIHAAMQMKSDYDRNQVAELLILANTLMRSNWGQYMPHTTSMIITQIRNAVGKKDISKEVNLILDYLVDAQLHQAKDQWIKLLGTKVEKLNISGVVSQGKVAIQGQHALKALYDALTDANFTVEQLTEQIAEIDNLASRTTDNSKRLEYEGKKIGYIMAQQYKERVETLQQERQQLKDELQQAHANTALSNTARRELEQAIKLAMRENYLDQSDAYIQCARDLQDYINEQHAAAKDFLEKQAKNREKIRTYASLDLAGVAGNPNRLRTRNGIARQIADAFTSPIRDLQSLLRMCGTHAINGEGYLYNHFMRGWTDNADTERRGIVAAQQTLDNKITELTNGKYKTWEEAAQKIKSASKKNYSIKLWTGEFNGASPVYEDTPITANNALYIYAVNKMTDGKMKLRAMNIAENDVDDLVNQVRDQFGQEIIDIVDWVQSEFFVQLRNRYNPTHEALFGAPMDAIDNYFPLRINPNVRQKNEDLGDPDTDAARLLIGTITGAIKRRIRNMLALDVRNADFFAEVIRHISQMERWNAFAQWNRDANILFSDIDFRNRIKSMKTIYGTGDKLYNYMKDAFRVSMGTYRPKTDTFSEITLNAAKGVTSAKINFRTFTALKQLVSFPAFFTYMTDGVFVKSYMRNWIHPHDTMKWAKEVLPNFEKRINKRDMGDMRLMQRSTDWQWNKRMLELSSKYGMAANVFFDTLTCATGAKAVYDSKFVDYLRKGYSQEEAEKRARQDAEQSFNTSQQSSEGAYMSPVQQDRNLITAALTVFRTSPIQYTRNFIYHCRNLYNKIKGNEQDFINFRTNQYIADGLSQEQATEAAQSDYKKSKVSDIIGVVVYGAILNILWRIAGQFPYLLLGDDDDKKKKIAKESVTGGAFISPLTGLLGGGIVESALDGNGSVADMFAPEMPFAQDVKRVFSYLTNDKYAEFTSLALSVAMQSSTGFDPQTAADMIARTVTTLDSDADLEAAQEALQISQALLSIPQSQYEQMLVDNVINEPSQYRKAVADYQRYQAVHTAPLTWYLRSDESVQKTEKAAKKRFDKLLKERKELKQ